MMERMQTRLNEGEKKMEMMVTTLQNYTKESQKIIISSPVIKKGKVMERKSRTIRRKEEVEKSTPQANPQEDCVEQLHKESSMFNNYFNHYTSIPKGKLSLKFTMSDIKFHETKTPTIMRGTSLAL